MQDDEYNADIQAVELDADIKLEEIDQKPCADNESDPEKGRSEEYNRELQECDAKELLIEQNDLLKQLREKLKQQEEYVEQLKTWMNGNYDSDVVTSSSKAMESREERKRQAVEVRRQKEKASQDELRRYKVDPFLARDNLKSIKFTVNSALGERIDIDIKDVLYNASVVSAASDSTTYWPFLIKMIHREIFTTSCRPALGPFCDGNGNPTELSVLIIRNIFKCIRHMDPTREPIFVRAFIDGLRHNCQKAAESYDREFSNVKNATTTGTKRSYNMANKESWSKRGRKSQEN